jgi:hypothetical protein
MTPRLSLRTIVILIGLTICIIAVVAVLMALDGRKDAARAKAGATLSDGRTAAAQDASAVRDRADERDDAISAAVTEGTSDVRQATDRAAANRAARRGVCRVNPGAHPDCRLLLADPNRMD